MRDTSAGLVTVVSRIESLEKQERPSTLYEVHILLVLKALEVES